jgi:hypothetical protein
MSPARLGAFAQRVASTIVKREVAVAHDDNFRNMKVRAPKYYLLAFLCV